LLHPHIKNTKTEGNSACYEIGPIETGYAVAFANALRRVLLSSLPGAAIISMRIQGVQHEFQDIPNVKEDVADIVLNLKKLRLRSFSGHAVSVYLDVQGPHEVRAADIIHPATVEIVSPDLHIATLDNEDAHLDMELVVGTGRGFVEADAQPTQEKQPIGVILIDAIYSPVLKVNFTLEHTHVGRMENFDKIVFELITDGTISPDDALCEGAAILLQQFRVFADYYPQEEEGEKRSRTLSDVRIPSQLCGLPLDELGLSVRAYNSLKRYGITSVGQVLEMNEEELLCVRNFGVKGLQELIEIMQENGCLPVLSNNGWQSARVW